MTSTAQIRRWWDPACTDHREQMRASYSALDTVLAKWGYQVRKEDTGAANCRKITGGSGYSLHAYFDGAKFSFWTGATVTMAVAVDVNWRTNPYGKRLVTDMPRGMIDEILAIRTTGDVQVWGWGGNYKGNKDAMHFEILASPQDLASGVVIGPKPAAPPKCYEAHPTLRNGDRGRPVNHLQYLLTRTGAKLTGDGQFGNQTESAVRNYQTWAKLTSDGVAGRKTWASLHQHVDGHTI